MASIVWRVKISLRDVEPPVWRVLLVRPDTTLLLFHRYVNIAMGWEDRHPFSFDIAGRTYCMPDPEGSRSKKTEDPRGYTLLELFPILPAEATYTYDFGDWWRHDIEFIGPEEATFRKQYPICADGDGNCPPEDCGGPPGYARLREVGNFEAGHLRDFWVQRATWDLRDVQRGLR